MGNDRSENIKHNDILYIIKCWSRFYHFKYCTYYKLLNVLHITFFFISLLIFLFPTERLNMSLSPVPRESGAGSPEIFLPDIRCNLDSQFQDARESTKCESMCVYARVRPLLLQESAKGHKVSYYFLIFTKFFHMKNM